MKKHNVSQFVKVALLALLCVGKAFSQSSPPPEGTPPTPCPPSVFTMDCLISTNLRAKDDVKPRMSKFRFFREYHDWSNDVGFDANSLANCPDKLYRWNPGYDNLAPSFDDFYSQFPQRAVVTFKNLAPEMRGIQNFSGGNAFFDVESEVLLEQKPVCFDYSAANLFCNDPLQDPYHCLPNAAGQLVPANYLEHARWFSLFAARYAQPPANSGLLANFLQPNMTPGQGNFDSWRRNSVKYFENSNETDKNWHDENFFGPFDNAQALGNFLNSGEGLWHFTPGQFAAMTSADFDGHQSAMTSTNGTLLGLRNIDPTARFVLGGLANIRPQYIRDMIIWNHTNRPNATKITFDVVNYHHYSTNFIDWGGNQQEIVYPIGAMENTAITPLGNFGVSPEEDDLKGKLQHGLNHVLSFVHTVNGQNFNYGTEIANNPNTEFWLSEFGYDSNPLSQQASIPNMLVKDVPGITSQFVAGTNVCGMATYNVDITDPALALNFRHGMRPNCDANTALPNGGFASGLLRRHWQQLSLANRQALTRAVENAQADWLARSYLEISAVSHSSGKRYTRAMQFCLTDRPEADPGVFGTPGLLRGELAGHKAKKSWYWVQTMKNLLAGYVFASEHSQSNCSSARVYRYTKLNNPDIFVIWRATGTNAPISLCNISVPSGLGTATAITMEIGDENGFQQNVLNLNQNLGISTAITVNAQGANTVFNNFPLSETPIFLRVGSVTEDAHLACPAGLTFTPISCDAVRLRWTATQAVPYTAFHAYYAKTSEMPDASDFDISDPRVSTYSDDLSGTLNNAVIAELEECTEYWIFFRGVLGTGETTQLCAQRVTTTDCSCRLSPSLFTLTELSPNVTNYTVAQIQSLFDYTNLDLCNFNWYGTPVGNGWDGNFFSNCTGSPTCQDELYLTFNYTVLLDVIYLNDIDGNSPFLIHYDADNVGDVISPATWTLLTTYQTREDDGWAALTRFNHLQPIRRLKFTKTKRDEHAGSANIRRIVFCGRRHLGTPAQGEDPKEKVDSYTELWNDPHKVTLSWDAVTKINNDDVIGYAERYVVRYSDAINESGEMVNPKEKSVVATGIDSGSPVLVSTVIEDENIKEDRFYVNIAPCQCPLAIVDGDGGTSGRSSDESGKQRLPVSGEYIQLYPNPASQQIEIHWRSSDFQALLLLDFSGKILRQFAVSPSATEFSMDISDLTEGVFIVALRGEGKTPLYGKLVIARP